MENAWRRPTSFYRSGSSICRLGSLQQEGYPAELAVLYVSLSPFGLHWTSGLYKRPSRSIHESIFQSSSPRNALSRSHHCCSSRYCGFSSHNHGYVPGKTLMFIPLVIILITSAATSST